MRSSNRASCSTSATACMRGPSDFQRLFGSLGATKDKCWANCTGLLRCNRISWLRHVCPLATSIAVRYPPPEQLVSRHLRYPRSRISPLS